MDLGKWWMNLGKGEMEHGRKGAWEKGSMGEMEHGRKGAWEHGRRGEAVIFAEEKGSPSVSLWRSRRKKCKIV